MVAMLFDEQTAFDGLRYKPLSYFFPPIRNIPAPAMDFLWKILEQKTVQFNLEGQACKNCYSNRLVMQNRSHRQGWQGDYLLPLHKITREVGPTHVLYYVRRLMCGYVEYFLQSHNPKAFPSSEFPSVSTLYEAILRRFSRKSLLRIHEPSAFSKPDFKFHE